MVKNITLIVIIFSILVSCQPKGTTSKESQADSTKNEHSPIVVSRALPEYKLFISKLNVEDVKSATLAAEKFQEIFKNKDVNIADSAFLVFDAYYENLDKKLNGIHEKDTTDYSSLVSGQSKVPQKLKEFNDNLTSNGFEIGVSEGNTFIKQNRDFIEKWFYPYVSPAMKEYLIQLNKENKKVFTEDGGTSLEAKQFVDRIIW